MLHQKVFFKLKEEISNKKVTTSEIRTEIFWISKYLTTKPRDSVSPLQTHHPKSNYCDTFWKKRPTATDISISRIFKDIANATFVCTFVGLSNQKLIRPVVNSS